VEKAPPRGGTMRDRPVQKLTDVPAEVPYFSIAAGSCMDRGAALHYSTRFWGTSASLHWPKASRVTKPALVRAQLRRVRPTVDEATDIVGYIHVMCAGYAAGTGAALPACKATNR